MCESLSLYGRFCCSVTKCSAYQFMWLQLLGSTLPSGVRVRADSILIDGGADAEVPSKTGKM